MKRIGIQIIEDYQRSVFHMNDFFIFKICIFSESLPHYLFATFYRIILT